jgi:cytidylate kinase
MAKGVFMIITIDGPVATGKSTIAKKLAEKLGFIYFDTGAMYRCITFALLEQGISLTDADQIRQFLETYDFHMKTQRGEKHYFVSGQEVTDLIRSEVVTAHVSQLSALAVVREKLVALQRELAHGINAVFEGRDIGTVVFPEAELKIFLTGRLEVRAKRRLEELRRRFPETTQELTLEKVMLEINARDTYDSTRALSPLWQADDAYVVDTSDLTTDEIVFKIIECKDAL